MAETNEETYLSRSLTMAHPHFREPRKPSAPAPHTQRTPARRDAGAQWRATADGAEDRVEVRSPKRLDSANRPWHRHQNRKGTRCPVTTINDYDRGETLSRPPDSGERSAHPDSSLEGDGFEPSVQRLRSQPLSVSSQDCPVPDRRQPERSDEPR